MSKDGNSTGAHLGDGCFTGYERGEDGVRVDRYSAATAEALDHRHAGRLGCAPVHQLIQFPTQQQIIEKV